MATPTDIQPNGTSSRELLSFRIADQEFCIDIMAVREIRGWTPTTPLPFAPSYMKGVVNLRGKVMPIVDLAERLGLPIVEPTPQHVIIVAELGNQTAGLLVSAVCDILSMSDAVIQDVPDVASGIVREHLLGLLTVNDKMVGLLSTAQIVPAAVAAQLDGSVEPMAA
jgi:purine-binding chemotaxis protein CheW